MPTPAGSSRGVRRRRPRGRRSRSQEADAPAQLSLDFDQPTPVEAIDPGGTPLPSRPAKPEPAERQAEPGDFVSPAEPTVPSGLRARAEANIAALRVLKVLEAEKRPATRDEQRVLAGWSSWGALPKVFEDDLAWDDVRTQLRELVSDDELAAARTTVLNAHYSAPLVVRQTWRAVTELGFAGGRVLEPGCGSGNFIGHAPATAEMVGVELDPTSARIAAALYPSATIRSEGFERTRLPEGSFVAAVGNVPFGGFALFDPDYNPGSHHIHDHFILKALRLTAPGGLVAVVTSAGTMDKQNPSARREMHTYGDLVGAIRLPSGAMAHVAGTDVVTDLVILRRRRDGESPAELTGRWERPVEVTTDSGPVTVNEWFATHPDLVLGKLEIGRGLYRDGEMRVQPDGRDLEAALAAAVDTIAADARAHGLMLDARPGDERTTEKAAEVVLVERDRPPKPGSIATTQDGGFARYTIDRGWVGHDAPAAQAAELRALLALRDEALAFVDAQATGGDRTEVQARRVRLNQLYDAYVQRHGPVNRYKLVQPRRDGAAPQKRRPPFGGLRKHDPDFAVVAALELFDEETGQVRKAPIFTVDVVRPRELHLARRRRRTRWP